jgi:hypothetical protein
VRWRGRQLLALTWLVALATSCTLVESQEYADRFEHETLRPVDIRLSIDRPYQRHRERYVAAVRTALRWFSEWFGPYPGDTIRLSIPGSVESSPFSPRASRQLERHIAQKIAADFWKPAADRNIGAEPSFRDALIGYSVDRLMREAYSGEGAFELRFFDGALPWAVRSVRTGLGERGSERAIRAFVTLERYLGWPVVQQSLAEFRARHVDGDASPARFLAVAGDVSGRDLDWMYTLFDASRSFDYGIERIDVQPAGGSASRVEVIVRRYGDGQFTGSSRPRAGAFESGRGVTVLVSFADGQEITEVWDGRDAERRFVYEAAVPVVSAVVDPDNTIAVDSRRANNVLRMGGAGGEQTNRVAVTWAVRWAGWLQDRLLVWSALF